MYSTRVVDAFNGQELKIAGFPVPLETNARGLYTSFFLVPYAGACIHVPPPPPTVEEGPSTPPPQENVVYVPGCWVYQQTRYFWRPGFWMPQRPGWCWVPARYVWTPGGCVFVDGYWDYVLALRGVLPQAEVARLFEAVRAARATGQDATLSGLALRQGLIDRDRLVHWFRTDGDEVPDLPGYAWVRKLGEGGMSYVYEARELSSGESVAIKVLSPKLGADHSSVERLRREAGLAMRLDHPHVCRILRLGETEDGLIYLVMPYLRGELLSDREVKVGPMPPDVAIPLLVQACAGLHHAHQLHIVHRDLKPENIMLVPGPDGDQAVVMDFGLAKENRAGSGLAKLTATGIILGTPEFMSPEQIRGKPLDARSDIYALGIVAFEMFTGKLPFQGRNAQEMMIARLRGQPIPLRQYRPDLPARLEKVLVQSMDANPESRYADARLFGLALLEVLEGSRQSALRPILQ